MDPDAESGNGMEEQAVMVRVESNRNSAHCLAGCPTGGGPLLSFAAFESFARGLLRVCSGRAAAAGDVRRVREAVHEELTIFVTAAALPLRKRVP